MHGLPLSEIGFVSVLKMELLVQIVERYKDSKLDVLTFNQVYKLIVWQQPEIFKTKCCVDALCLITTSNLPLRFVLESLCRVSTPAWLLRIWHHGLQRERQTMLAGTVQSTLCTSFYIQCMCVHGPLFCLKFEWQDCCHPLQQRVAFRSIRSIQPSDDKVMDKWHLLDSCESLFFSLRCRYPPGHGDVFPSLANSGKLDQLIAQVDCVCNDYLYDCIWVVVPGTGWNCLVHTGLHGQIEEQILPCLQMF